MSKYKKAAIERFGKIYNDTNEVNKNELIFTCIKCGRPKLYVNIANGVYHCFRCDFKGRLRARVSLADVCDKYNQDSLMKLTTSNNSNDLTLIPFFRKDLTEEQFNALKSRGITESDIRFYNICGRDEDNRIQIPNYIKGCFTDVICNWQYDKNLVNKRSPKYLNSEGTPKSKTLFNIYNIDKGINKIILTEGLFNAITAGRNAVASYGCSLSDRQCELIIEKEPKSILIAYDSDEAGVKGSCKAIDMFINANYKGVLEYILLPKGIDINDFGHDNFINYYESNKVIIDTQNPICKKLPELLYNSRM